MILIKFLSVDLIITPRLKNTRKKYVVYSAFKEPTVSLCLEFYVHKFLAFKRLDMKHM